MSDEGKVETTAGDLVQFFRLDEEEQRLQNRIEAAASTGASGVLSGALALLPPGVRKLALSSIAGTLKIVLQKPIKEILGKAWSTRRDLLRYRDRAKYPPEQTFDYDLKENEIEYSYEPAVQLVVNGAPEGPQITFKITLKLINTPALKIKDARIVAAYLGQLHGEGSIKCEDVVLVERKTEKAAMEGELLFEEGIAI